MQQLCDMAPSQLRDAPNEAARTVAVREPVAHTPPADRTQQHIHHVLCAPCLTMFDQV